MRKKGSALILSILMLSFFMTLTLTMYFIAKNRDQRSKAKIKGARLDSGLDTGSSLAHYELYLADEYVSKGHLYSKNMISYFGDSYVIPPTTSKYTTEKVIDDIAVVVPETGKHYTGVVLNNYNEYFGAYWDPTKGNEIDVTSESTVTSDAKKQPWIVEDKIDTIKLGEVQSRVWSNHEGEKIIRLWSEPLGTTKRSIGGYRLIKITGKDSSKKALKLPLDITKLSSSTATKIKFTYEKIISLESSSIGINEKYRITYVEAVEVISNGSDMVIKADNLDSMTVEKLK